MQFRQIVRKALIVAVCFVVAIIVATPLVAQTFAQTRFQTGPSPSGIKTADVNKDGNLDLILISQPAGKCSADLVVHLGDGKGSFGAAATFDSSICGPQGGSVSEFEVLDVNKDGSPDLVYAGADSLGIMLGNGDGTFQLPKLFPAVVSANDGLNSLGVADFNRDGNKDFIVSSNQYIEIFYGNGDGTVQSPPKLFQVGASNVEAGDFDNDGFDDFAFFVNEGADFAGSIQAWFGDATGNFADRRIVDTNTPLFFGLKVHDLNNDKRDDIAGMFRNNVFEGDYSQGPFTYTSNGDRTFKRNIHPSEEEGNTYGPTFADFNQDAVLDLATTVSCPTDPHTYCDFGGSPREDGVLLFPRSTDGTIGDPKKIAIALSTDGTDPNDVIAGDFNKDGLPDLAVTLHATNEIAVLLNQGGGGVCSAGALYTMHVCSPTNGGTYASPVPISASANSDHPIVAWKVYVDGVSKATGGSGASFQASVAMSAGTHRVTVKAWDSTGRGISGTVNITVSGSGGGGGTCSAGALYTVHLCSPANGGTYSSPVPVSATANSDHSITGWKLYVDGTFKASAGAVKSWNTSVAMSGGSHRVTVKAWDSTGRSMSSSVSITVH